MAQWCSAAATRGGRTATIPAVCGPPSTGRLPWEEEEAEVVRRDTSGELGVAQGGGDLKGASAAMTDRE